MITDKRVEYLDIDVVTAAKARIRRIYNLFDHVWISFSGGKDSLAVLRLCREVLDEMGRKAEPVNFLFRDEEVIQDCVIENVMSYMDRPGYNGRYYAIPMKSQIFVMGRHLPIAFWDTGREHMRTPPACAIRQIHPENKALRQTEINPLTFQHMGLKGKIAVVNGIRAAESMQRYRSCIAVKNKDNFICGDPTGWKNISFVKPIYDWSEKDIFKYFHTRDITYAGIYNDQLWTGQQMRVSTPLHEKAIDTLTKLRQTHPKFYERILEIWPEVEVQERYWLEYDSLGVINDYAKSWTGIVDYIKEKIDDPRAKKEALKAVDSCRKGKEANRRSGRYADPEVNGGCYGFPLLHVFKNVVGGKYAGGIANQPFPSPAEIGYERAAEEENLMLGVAV